MDINKKRMEAVNAKINAILEEEDLAGCYILIDKYCSYLCFTMPRWTGIKVLRDLLMFNIDVDDFKNEKGFKNAMDDCINTLKHIEEQCSAASTLAASMQEKLYKFFGVTIKETIPLGKKLH